MADDKIILTEIDIDMEQSIADTQKLREEFNRLKEETKRLKETEGETSAEYIKSNATLKQVGAELRSNEAITQKVIAANRSNKGSLDELKAQLAIVSKQWSSLSENERLNTEEGKKLSAQKLALTNQLKLEEKATGDTRRNVGNYTEAIEQATSGLGTMVPGLGKASGAVRAFGIAFKVALGPIGLILAAIALVAAALKAFFTRGEEGQDRLAKIMLVFKSVLDNILDVVGKLGEYIVKAFESPKEAIKALGELIKSQITNRIEALKDMGAAIVKIFSKDWKEGFKELGKNAVDFYTGVEDTIDKLKKKGKEFTDEIKREMEIARRLADMQAALDKRVRENIVLEQKDRLKLAKLKNEIDDKDKNKGEERLKLIDEENKVLDQILARNLDIAKTKYEIKKQQNALASSTKDDLNQEAQLLADIYKIEADITAQRKEAIAKRVEAQRQIASEALSQLEKELEIYKETNRSKLENAKELNQQLVDEEIIRLNASAEKEKEVLNSKLANNFITEQEYQLSLIQLENDKIDAITQLTQEWEESEKERKIEAAQIDYENDLELAKDSIFAELEVERQGLEIKKAQELEYAKKIGADTFKIEQKYSKAKKELARAERDAKLLIAQDFANNIATIAGEGTAIAKAAGVAATTIETFRAAQASYTGMVETIPGPIGIIAGIVAAAASVASGIANVKKILSVKSGLPGDSGGGTGGAAISPPTIAPPAAVRENVNPEIGAGIVSRQTGSESSQSSSYQPVLVEDDVTNKQRDRNTINNTSVV